MSELLKKPIMMIVINRLADIRHKLQHSKFLSYTYMVFLAGFFISPNNHLHRNFFYLFVIVPFLFYLDSRAIHSCIKSNLFKFSILFLFYFLISMVWTDADLTSEEYYDQIRYFLMLVLFIMATILISLNSNQFFSNIIFWLCLIALFASVIFILIFYASHAFPIVRLNGPFDYTKNPNQAAMHFGFVAILAYCSLYSAKGLYKIFYWSVLLALIAYILLSQSRGPLLAIFCSIFLGLIFEKRWRVIGISTIIFIGFIILVETIDIGIMRFSERGFSFRIDLWLGALKRISQVPVFGEGYFTDVTIMQISGMDLSPHNLLLLVMLKSGIMGGGLLLLLIITTLLAIYNYFKASGNWIFICLFVYFIICMTFDSAHLLYKPSLAWLIFWLPVGLVAGEEVRLKLSNPDPPADSLSP